jgi:hypothetical protein
VKPLEYNPSDEEHQEIMEYLISEGAAILEGIDENGEAIYKHLKALELTPAVMHILQEL